ncbi:two-component system response regulator HydG [Pontibacter ummariensis]|uniref:Two-component system, NtrC family, response regulator HydG n=1 Tax=Pontibacter ummariensis TaxID=1610492 RepID=A0A239CT75_9BACT|nr:sigma-54 dependent transcriptional regulator [Pontibacter ummariensis]PRY14857.1 two-component system response regulator HydG [Pontibacter ummariensis]SNS22958.1 two-component system, NtrC family, response regulator HydG [Pontibacter ummariensis]
MPKILLIDDDPAFCLMLKAFLQRQQYEVETAYTANDGLQALKSSSFDLVLTDFRLPDKDGLELLPQIRVLSEDLPVILMTHYADIRTAVRAIKMGAFEYITKPINPDETLLVVQNALSKKTAPAKAAAPAAVVGGFQFVRGQSPQASQIEEFISLVAPTNLSVIIEGESGTGKEYVASMIHRSSKRADKPFVAIDCGALSKELAGSELFGYVKGAFTGAMKDKQGQFEAAEGGTLFLDEIGNLPYEVQVKLLRALQERKVRKVGSTTDLDVDVRVLAATNEDLQQAVANGQFREDLYHRLNEFKINIPPLRERDGDVLLFARHFLQQANKDLERNVAGFEDEVEEAMENYNWPGNLRELRNVVKRAVLLAKTNQVTLQELPKEIVDFKPEPEEVVPAHTVIPQPITADIDLKSLNERNERELIVQMLERVKYNKSKAARLLKIDRKTLYNKLKLYNIEA